MIEKKYFSSPFDSCNIGLHDVLDDIGVNSVFENRKNAPREILFIDREYNAYTLKNIFTHRCLCART